MVYEVCIGFTSCNYWPIAVQFFSKLHSNRCGYLVIIRHLANNKYTAHSEAVLFLAACYLGKNCTLPEFYTVYEIAVRLEVHSRQVIKVIMTSKSNKKKRLINAFEVKT